ncbi:hypothetical protein STEG23_004261 [Scotinomys teguina]
MWSKRNTPPLLVGMQIGTTTVESSMENSQKIESEVYFWRQTEASELRSDRKIPSKETRQGYCHSFNRMLSPRADEDQEQQHGANAMVLKTGEEGGKTGLVQNKKSQGELGQGEFAPSKPDQEELPQSSLAQEATGRVEEREHKEEEMAGGCAGDDSSGPVNKGIHSEGGHCEAGANVGGSVYEGALSLDDSENQQGNVNQGGHMSPYNSLGPEGDHSNQVPMEEDPEEPDILLPEVPRRQPRRHQIQFHFTEWQVQEMETIFQETQYPDVLTRSSPLTFPYAFLSLTGNQLSRPIPCSANVTVGTIPLGSFASRSLEQNGWHSQRVVVQLPFCQAEPRRKLKDTLDMDHPHKFEHEDSNYQSLAVGPHLEEAKEAKSPEIHVGPAGDGGDQIWPKPDLGVVAEEDSAFGLEDVSEGAPGTKTNEENKDYDEQDQSQSALQAASRMPQVQDDTNLHRIYSALCGLELSELDCIFQCTHFPDRIVWKELGGLVNVEAKAEPCGPKDQESE